MHTTRFCNKSLRNKTNKNKKKYTKQRNYCLTYKKNKARILQQPGCKEYYQQQNVLENSKTFSI